MPRRVFLLISGAWHGSWCWNKIVSRLERAGHGVIAPDLPGYGLQSPPLRAITLEMWTQHVCEILEAQSEPVTLVGHSRAGIVLSQVAEHLPGKVRNLVYVSGFLLQAGESILRVLRADGSSALLTYVNLTHDKGAWVVAETAVKELFYGECTDSDTAFASARLAPEPAEPLMTPIQITAGQFGRVPRSYIECLRDKAIPLALQRKMHTASPCRQVLTLDCDHSPFFSAPDELTEQLLRLVTPAKTGVQ